MNFDLQAPYKPAGGQPEAIKNLVEGFRQGKSKQTLLGITGSGKTHVASHIIKELGKKTLVLAHNKTLAAQLYRELKAFFPHNRVEYFVSFYDYYQPESYLPTTDTYIEKDSAKNEEIDRMRLRATASLLERDDVIVVASVSCIYGLGDPKNWLDMSLRFNVEESMSREDVIRGLVDMQYERNDQAPTPGQFRVRGDTIDVVPSYQDDTVRIELFGEEIERLSVRHHVTGEETERLQQLIIFPAKHFVTPEHQQEQAIKSIREELEEQLPKMELLEAQRLKQRTEFDLEMIEELGYCNGIENYSRHFDGREQGQPPFTLLDFFGDDWLLIIDESHQTIPQIHGMYKGDRSRKQSLIDYGFRLPSAYDNRPLTFQEFYERMPEQTLFVSATPGEWEVEQSRHVEELIIRPTGLLDPHITVKETRGQIDDLIEECTLTKENGNRVLVTTMTKKMAEDLTNYLSRHSVNVRYLHSEIDTIERTEILRQLRAGDFDVLVGINLLREGIDLPEVELVAILDADKEGFLRNTRSLLQIVGRAARNQEGRVIMYADKTTRSMQETITITHARREAQKKYNEENNITPTTIKKPIEEAKIHLKDIKHIPETKIEEMITQLREEMQEASKKLEFELAIHLRDRIKELEARLNKKQN
ncbi:MAG: excinuclease ABC subunit UvrB [Candidatus Woesearchaeota archaeon]